LVISLVDINNHYLSHLLYILLFTGFRLYIIVILFKGPYLEKRKFPHSILVITCTLFFLSSEAQMITGVWEGKINKQRAEVKIILNGDSLTGTSYYYESPDHYRRYSIKGYFDANTNEAVWWDDVLLEEKTGQKRKSPPGVLPMLSRADFNCPGGGKMMLDGKAGKKEDNDPDGDIHLDKTGNGIFGDEWDFVIDNYLVGGNDPRIIDSIGALAYQQPMLVIEEEPIILPPVRKKNNDMVRIPPQTGEEKPQTNNPPPVVQAPAPKKILPPQSIEDKFITRKKVFVTEIPVSGDSIELKFYDNAEIDGDSITLFLNDKLIFEHIRLLGSAYTIKLAVNDLADSNELTMVAENLGTIPPNTSYMIAEVDGKRYDARLESTEGSSAMVRFVKKKQD
jgi:hypothetical protein